MTKTDVEGALIGARWAICTGGTSEGFRVSQGKDCLLVSWVSPTWNAKTMKRMLKNYQKALEDKYDVTLLRSHLVIR